MSTTQNSQRSSKGVAKASLQNAVKTCEAERKAGVRAPCIERVVQVPVRLVGKIIGKEGKEALRMIDEFGLVSLTAQNENDKTPRQEGQKGIILKGTAQTVENAKKAIISKIERETKKIVTEFSVKDGLMGLVIGKNHSNIKEARAMPGIYNIFCKSDPSVVVIEGETSEAVANARQMLEYTRSVLGVPAQFVGRIIGKSGSNLQAIQKESGVVKIYADSTKDVPEEPGVVRFIIVGLVPSVEMARSLLQTQVDEMKRAATEDDRDSKSTAGNRRDVGHTAGYRRDVGRDNDDGRGWVRGSWSGAVVLPTRSFSDQLAAIRN